VLAGAGSGNCVPATSCDCANELGCLCDMIVQRFGHTVYITKDTYTRMPYPIPRTNVIGSLYHTSLFFCTSVAAMVFIDSKLFYVYCDQGFFSPTGPVKPPPSGSGLSDRFDRKPVEFKSKFKIACVTGSDRPV